MTIIIAILTGLALGYILAAVFQRKKIPPPRNPDQHNLPQQVFPPQQSPSYLEDKIWYESEMEFLFKFNEKLISSFSPQDVIQSITEAAHNFLPIERTVFLSWDKSPEKLVLECSIGWRESPKGEPLEIDKDSISGFVIRNREPLVMPDLARDPYWSKLNKEEYLQKTFISAPLIYKNEVLGILHVCDKKTSGSFTEREVSVVMNIARMGAIALQNARLHEQAARRAAELKIAYDELKEMQDKLIQSEKLKAIGQLASGVAHEIRNPIGIIMQGVSYLEQVIPPEEKDYRETLSIVKESTQRADKIVISLLDFSRATKLELHPEDIRLILENSITLVKTELKDIELVREIQEGLPEVLVDKNKLTQVFINMFMNAVHAMPGGGRLIVRGFVRQMERAGGDKALGGFFEAGEKAVVVEIEDTGTGISEENLKKIFDPFFTTKGPGKGTGLGLSISQNIIILHRGRIEIESRMGKGTKMIITLRVSKEEAGNG